jgi:hypothetical protein
VRIKPINFQTETLRTAIVVAKPQRVCNCRAHAPRDFFQSEAKGGDAAARNHRCKVVRLHRQLINNPDDLLAGRCQRVLYLRDPHKLAAALVEVEPQELRAVYLRGRPRAS